ncbi:GNAT family N-acetyltransferase [Maridesulfovibrio sp. FT414]|uniref:GNAT family N-acetyltransferase n=1 Tax=Maridesulfovibrio sp. FT414 TaxID=2979469 RepID=UPI003D8063F1
MYGFEMEGGYTFYKYRDFDGTVSLSEAHLKWFWTILYGAGTLPVIFYETEDRSFESFRRLAEMEDQHFFFGFKDQQPSGMFWLNGFAPRSCFVHIASMPAFYGRGAVEMARGGLRHLLAVTDASGGPLFDCIKGLIPAANPLACRMAEKAGFKKVGVIPQGAYLADQDISTDAVLFAAVRE